ncbi:MAG: hypothetical protein M1824_002455 [Vezdaea acicularis]|nr:MAG: hypothetical protein M1824_002455 [Vezdaea acicularis]
MAKPSLTIRNLTPHPLHLTLVERYLDPKGSAINGTAYATGSAKGPLGSLTGLTSSFSSLLPSASSSQNSGSPTAPQLTSHAQSFTRHEVAYDIPPYTTLPTDLFPAIHASVESPQLLRLTFTHANHERHRVDLPSARKHSGPLTPLTPTPRHALYCIFHPSASHLTLLPAAPLSSWMSALHPSTPLSALSIPGTHNSPTAYPALPSVRCQSVPIPNQLEQGIRFLDIRVHLASTSPTANSPPPLTLVHGAFPISLRGTHHLLPLLHQITTFLDTHPTETVLLSLKLEGTTTTPSPSSPASSILSTILHKHYTTDPTKWYTLPHIPSLAECARRIVLIRRFALAPHLVDEGYGIDAEDWPYNAAHALTSSGACSVQDVCDLAHPAAWADKAVFVKEHLTRAAATSGEEIAPPPPPDGPRVGVPLHLNFLSAANFWRRGCWPERVARRLNPAVVEFLCVSHGSERLDPESGHEPELEQKSQPAHRQGEQQGELEQQEEEESRKNQESKEGVTTKEGTIWKDKPAATPTGILVCDWLGEGGDWDLVRCVVGMNRFRPGGLTATSEVDMNMNINIEE